MRVKVVSHTRGGKSVGAHYRNVRKGTEKNAVAHSFLQDKKLGVERHLKEKKRAAKNSWLQPTYNKAVKGTKETN